MADARYRITTPLFFILANFAFGDVTPEIIVQSNGNFTLQPNVQSPPEDILWTWNENKVVEFYQNETVYYGQFKGRTTLDLTTGALTLTHLTEADSGEYVGELQIKGQLVHHRQTVKVFDAVGKPAVTCQVNGSSVTLLCSGGDRPSTQYRWEGPAIEPQPGSQLKIEAAESSDAVYTCVLHNPVGESRTDFPVKSCFHAPDAVGKPAVTCQVNNSSVTLLCSGGDRPSTQYRWEGPAIQPQPGSQLKIEAAESSDAIYTCVLHNPVGESRTDFPVKSCFPAPGSASVIISVVIVLLLFIIVGLLLFYYKTFYKKRLNEEDTEAQSEEKARLRERDSEAAVNGELQNSVIHSGLRAAGDDITPSERQQLLPADTENAEETPVRIGERVKQYENMTSPGKTHDEHQKTALTEQHKGFSQEESQTESLNRGEEPEERGVETEGGNPKHPSPGTVPSSAPESPPAAPPKTGSAEETIHPPKSSPSLPHPPNSAPHPAPVPVQSQNQEEETGRAAAAESTDETAANQRAGAQRQREKRGGQNGGSDGGGAQPSGAGGGGAENPTADPAQELLSSPEEEEDIQGSLTESLNQGEDSEERGVVTEGGNSKHPSSVTVAFSDPESSPKTGNEEKTFPTPPSSPSPPHPPKSPPHPAPALVQSQDQEEETENEETFYPALSDLSEPEGSDGGGAQPSGAGGGGAENPTAAPAQGLPSSPEEEEDILRQGPETDGGAAQCSEAGGGGDQSVPKPDSDQDINSRSAEENLSVPLTEPLSTADPAQGLPDPTARSPPHTGASEESCCAEESPTSGPNLEPNSTSEAEEDKKRGREERKDSQDTPPVKPQRTYIPSS